MKNRLTTRILFFILGLLLVTVGNALMILSGEGNGIWTAAAFQQPLSLMIILIGCAVILLNMFLLPAFSWWHVAGSVLFVFFFGELIHFFANFLAFLRPGSEAVFMKLALVVLGIVLVCLGTSFYQRASLWMYPTDFLTDILAIRFFDGKAWKGQLLAFAPAVSLILLAFFLKGQLIGIQIGTVLALLFNGELIGLFHRYAFPSFKHN